MRIQWDNSIETLISPWFIRIMARERELHHLPLKVLLNLTDLNFSENVENLRKQITAAGAICEVTQNLSAEEFLDLVISSLAHEQVAVMDQGLITGQAMMDAVAKGQWSTSAALVKPSAGVASNCVARVIHKRIVSAATSEHRVTQPTHDMLGFIRIGSDEKSRAALLQARDYCKGMTREVNIGDLITVALVRAGAPVVAIGVTGVCARANTSAELPSAQMALDAQDENDVRTKRALLFRKLILDVSSSSFAIPAPRLCKALQSNPKSTIPKAQQPVH